jgi:integrase
MESRGCGRVIFLNAKAHEIIKPFLKPDLSAHLFSPAEAEAERLAAKHAARKTPLSCGNVPGSHKTRKPRRTPGASYDENSYRRAITRACKLAEVPTWTPYQIRHTAAEQMREKHGLEAAQFLLGHKTLTVTQVYAKANKQKAREAALKMGA